MWPAQAILSVSSGRRADERSVIRRMILAKNHMRRITLRSSALHLFF